MDILFKLIANILYIYLLAVGCIFLTNWLGWTHYAVFKTAGWFMFYALANELIGTPFSFS